MVEYNKIETPFVRDVDGSKKLIRDKFRNPTIEYLKDNEWAWTEKIDGTNIRIHWDGHKVEFGGRTDRASIPAHLINKLNELFGGEINEEIFEQKFGDSDVILFGEGYGYKIQNGGDYLGEEVGFILFDVMIGNLYLTRENVEDIATAFNIDVVPIIFNGTINEAVEYMMSNPKSTIGTATMEGLVGRPNIELKDRKGNRVIVKVKWNDVKEFI